MLPACEGSCQHHRGVGYFESEKGSMIYSSISVEKAQISVILLMLLVKIKYILEQTSALLFLIIGNTFLTLFNLSVLTC